MYEKINMKEFIGRVGTMRDLNGRDMYRLDCQKAIRPIVPSGWNMVVADSSILLQPEQGTLPSIKITYRGTIYHDFGTRRKPTSVARGACRGA